ncbi:MAG: retropepsin-like aspartic protease [Planctomycetota bacterium]
MSAIIIFIISGCLTQDYALPPMQIENPDILLTVLYQSPNAAVVPAVINRQGPFRCMIDSGSRGSVVSPSVADQLAPKERMDDEYLEGDRVSIRSWSVSGVAFIDFTAIVSDPGDVDCILGANALVDLVVGWRPTAGTLYLNADPLIDDGSSRIAIELSGGRPFISAVIGGRQTNAVLLAPGLPQSRILRGLADALGAADGATAVETTVSVNNEPARSLACPIIDEPATGLFHRTPDIVLGGDAFKDRLVIIDFPNASAYIILAPLDTGFIASPPASDR